MKKIFAFLLLFFSSIASLATDVSVSNYFQNKSGCFILYDLNESKTLIKFNPERCAQRISPDSTFKIALSLMAFDAKLINPNTVFRWDGKDKGNLAWNQDQTPESWIKNSTVWVSQELTVQLGMPRIQQYLKLFNYGNRDFTNLKNAWLSGGSLKISADEQLVFLKALAMGKLPVSNEALLVTKYNMRLGALPNGWNLYGKTGSGFSPANKVLRDGWFIGFLEKGNKTNVFVLNFSDTKPPDSNEPGGIEAKKMVQSILLNFYRQYK